MRTSATFLVAVVACLLTNALPAQTIALEDFEDGVNEYSWGIGVDIPVVEPTGGNPGQYLREGPFEIWAPQIRVGSVGSPRPWTGDFVAQGVTEASVDLITIDPVSVTTRELCFVLFFGMNTPDPQDDALAYVPGPPVPAPGSGWTSYSFTIPRTTDPLPAGWDWVIPPTAPVVWNELLTHVTIISYFYGNPTTPWPEQTWNIGVDNLRVGTAADDTFRRGDCNGEAAFDVSDVVFILSFFFTSGTAAPCESACDANDDGLLDVADAIRMLGSLFVADPPLPAPIGTCGEDPTPDSLTCSTACP